MVGNAWKNSDSNHNQAGDELPGKEADEPDPGSPRSAQELAESQKQEK